MSTGDARRSTPSRPDDAWTPSRVIVAAVVVCVAYFLGAQLGLHLRLPGATPSVFWPPNALLTGALLLVPPRLWAVIVLAALPAHLDAQHWARTGRAAMIGLCSSPTAARRSSARRPSVLSDAPVRFDSLGAPVRVRRLGRARRAGRLELPRRRRGRRRSARSPIGACGEPARSRTCSPPSRWCRPSPRSPAISPRTSRGHRRGACSSGPRSGPDC